jgi:hypothetical protein
MVLLIYVDLLILILLVFFFVAFSFYENENGERSSAGNCLVAWTESKGKREDCILFGVFSTFFS